MLLVIVLYTSKLHVAVKAKYKSVSDIVQKLMRKEMMVQIKNPMYWPNLIPWTFSLPRPENAVI